MTKVECIVKAMDDKLAQDIVAINMENASPLYDTLFYVLHLINVY